MKRMPDAVSVVGLGKLGACMAACMASKGILVVGVDTNERVVLAINTGDAPHHEPGLEQLLRHPKAPLTAMTDYSRIAETDITFIVVPTPSEPSGAFSLRHVKEVATAIGRALRDKSGYHVVAVTSTVLPGSCQYGILPILERESGKKLGEGFGLVYNPEFIALGTVIRDFLNPDFVLIGESDKQAGDQVAKIYEAVCRKRSTSGHAIDSLFTYPAHVARMSIPSAELAKIGLNWMLVNKINAANMFGQLAERIPGANVDDVTTALGMDSRIGPKFLKAAMSASGPCLPRDAVALHWLADVLGLETIAMAEAVCRVNRLHLDRLQYEVACAAPNNTAIAVLGLAYKPGTNVVEGSPGYTLASRLAADGFRSGRVHVFDPLVSLGPPRTYRMDTLTECIKDATVIVVANPDPAFVDLGDCTGKIVIDPWRIVTGHDGADYRPFGIGATDSVTETRLRQMWS